MCVYVIGAIAAAGAYFGPGTGPILLDNVECTGNEQRLAACPNQRIGLNDCLHSEDASVICQGKCKQAMSPWINKNNITYHYWVGSSNSITYQQLR